MTGSMEVPLSGTKTLTVAPNTSDATGVEMLPHEPNQNGMMIRDLGTTNPINHPRITRCKGKKTAGQ